MAGAGGGFATVRAGDRALPVRTRIRLAHRDGGLRARHGIHAGGGVDAASRWPCARRYLLCGRLSAYQSADRSAWCPGSPAAVHDRVDLVIGALRGAVLVDP